MVFFLVVRPYNAFRKRFQREGEAGEGALSPVLVKGEA